MKISTDRATTTQGYDTKSVDRTVPVRDVHLEHAFASVPKYFANGDIVMSHMFAVLSATFPDGESRQLLQYHRRGFHPNDRSTTELVARWRKKLFADSPTTSTANSPSRVAHRGQR